MAHGLNTRRKMPNRWVWPWREIVRLVLAHEDPPIAKSAWEQELKGVPIIASSVDEIDDESSNQPTTAGAISKSDDRTQNSSICLTN